MPHDVLASLPPPEKSGNSRLILGLIFGGLGTFVILCGGGCWLGMSLLFGEFASQVRTAVADNPILSEHVGEIREFTYDVQASLNEPSDDVHVFQVVGTKGSGILRAECITVNAGAESVTSAELLLDGGKAIQLFPDEPLEPGGS